MNVPKDRDTFASPDHEPLLLDILTSERGVHYGMWKDRTGNLYAVVCFPKHAKVVAFPFNIEQKNFPIISDSMPELIEQLGLIYIAGL